jgi:hypothetical protein
MARKPRTGNLDVHEGLPSAPAGARIRAGPAPWEGTPPRCRGRGRNGQVPGDTLGQCQVTLGRRNGGPGPKRGSPLVSCPPCSVR